MLNLNPEFLNGKYLLISRYENEEFSHFKIETADVDCKAVKTQFLAKDNEFSDITCPF